MKPKIKHEESTTEKDGILFNKSTGFSLSPCHNMPLIRHPIFFRDGDVRQIGFASVCSGWPKGTLCLRPHRYRSDRQESYQINDAKVWKLFPAVWERVKQVGAYYGDAGHGFYCRLVNGILFPLDITGETDSQVKTEIVGDDLSEVLL